MLRRCLAFIPKAAMTFATACLGGLIASVYVVLYGAKTFISLLTRQLQIDAGYSPMAI